MGRWQEIAKMALKEVNVIALVDVLRLIFLNSLILNVLTF
jgi:hypothetical protein